MADFDFYDQSSEKTQKNTGDIHILNADPMGNSNQNHVSSFPH